MISLSHLPIISALVNNMDEGFIVYNKAGQVVFTNPAGDCCLKGHKVVLNQLETEVQVGGETYRSVLYVIDHEASKNIVA